MERCVHFVVSIVTAVNAVGPYTIFEIRPHHFVRQKFIKKSFFSKENRFPCINIVFCLKVSLISHLIYLFFLFFIPQIPQITFLQKQKV